MSTSMRKTIIISLLVAIALLFPLDGYISRPGQAFEIEPLVHVEGEDDEPRGGAFHLMTIAIGKGNTLFYGLSFLSDTIEWMPNRAVRQDGESDEVYALRQKRLMYNSQQNASIVAFQKANAPYTVSYDGVYVLDVVEGSPADGRLEPGDQIESVDGVRLTEKGQFAEIVRQKKEGDSIHISFLREPYHKETSMNVEALDAVEGKVGVGIRYEENRTVKTDPHVTFDETSIGGPSAGFMFTLEMIDQLTPSDLTKGYLIAGTGEMDEDGTVGRIGGIDYKVRAADQANMEIFFAPDDPITEQMKKDHPTIQSNYAQAVETAEKIGTAMEIVPVRTIDDALDYLEKLPPKEEK